MLLLPSLDNRTFDQLFAEGRGLIPGIAPGWTDQNYSDPGVTVIELLAWLSETILYRLDRTPDEMRRAFLRLVGFEPRPALVAETVLLLSSTAGSAPVDLPGGLQLADAGALTTFQTAGPVVVSPAAMIAVLTGPEAAPADVTAANGASGFLPFGPSPAAGDALYLAFDAPLGPQGSPLALHIWTGDPPGDAATRARLRHEEQARRADGNGRCGCDATQCDWRLYPGVVTVWEYPASADRWLALDVAEDATRALTLTGFVRLTAPPVAGSDAHQPGGVAPGYVIRCRLATAAPDCGPPLSQVGVNAVVARHAADAPPDEPLGASSGRARELYQLALTPVVAGSCRLAARDSGGLHGEWDSAEVWDLIGPHDRRCLLDPVGGVITSGDGARGRAFPAGAQISARYKQGGGALGNVAAGVLTTWLDNAHNHARVPGWTALAADLAFTQPVAAIGGADAEDIPTARARALAALAAPDKAVTLADFERLALATPGVPTARAYALAEHHPDYPCFTVEGSVTVTVIPNCPGPEPTPTAGLLAAVGAYLDRRRLLTTEVHVAAPTYTPINVVATLVPEAAADLAALAAAAKAMLDRYLHPLTGGPDGSGWTAGRTVFSAEVLALLAEIPGVAGVTGLTLQAGDAPPTVANITLCPTEFVASGTHSFSGAGAAPSPSAVSKPDDCCR